THAILPQLGARRILSLRDERVDGAAGDLAALLPGGQAPGLVVGRKERRALAFGHAQHQLIEDGVEARDGLAGDRALELVDNRLERVGFGPVTDRGDLLLELADGPQIVVLQRGGFALFQSREALILLLRRAGRGAVVARAVAAIGVGAVLPLEPGVMLRLVCPRRWGPHSVRGGRVRLRAFGLLVRSVRVGWSEGPPEGG